MQCRHPDAPSEIVTDREQDIGVVDAADFSDRCESAGYEVSTPSCHQLVWRAVLQALARPVVEFVGDLAQLLVADRSEVDALGEVLAQQAVGVLVRAALPG